MQLKKMIAPTVAAILPAALNEKFYGEFWLKHHIDVKIRDIEEALSIFSTPLPYLKLQFDVTNNLPVKLGLYGVNVEVWLGKPVIQFHSLSEGLRPNQTSSGLYAYNFLNNFQKELLNPSKKSTLPPNVTVNLTLYCRTNLGTVEKSIKKTWIAPKIFP